MPVKATAEEIVPSSRRRREGTEMAVHDTGWRSYFKPDGEAFEIEGANPFRVRAYRRAASAIENLPSSVAAMVGGVWEISISSRGREDSAAEVKEIVLSRPATCARSRRSRRGRRRRSPL